jgi:hypothetical protein
MLQQLDALTGEGVAAERICRGKLSGTSTGGTAFPE